MYVKAVFPIFVILAVALGIGLFYINAAKDPKEKDESEIIVNIPGQGRIRGGFGTTSWTNERFMKFLSIPYAESPSGPLRFKAPVPRLPWSHIHDGTTFSRGCPTMDSTNPTQELTSDLAEDCLTVSVYTKSLNASAPVLFFIISGAFVHGDSEKFNGDFLLSKDIVLVVMQYRLGPLGFLSFNTPDLPGNMGLADAIMALEWVQKNIHNFGGDKNQVTLAGQSAGSWLASVLLISPKTENKNLFHRVIMQSGQILSTWKQDLDPIEQTRRFCRNLSCQDCEDPDRIHACLKSKSLIDMRKATINGQEKFEPKTETQFNILPQHPNILLKNYNRSIPVMAGFQRHDGSLPLIEFYPEMKKKWGSFDDITVRQFVKELITRVVDYSGVINNVLIRLMFHKTPGLLDSNDHHMAIPAYFDVAGMLFVKSSILKASKSLTAKSLKEKTSGKENGADVFAYTFDYATDNTSLSSLNSNPWKNTVDHHLFNMYVFDREELNSKRDNKMAQQIVSLWTSFVITGIPKDLEDRSLSPMTRPNGPYIHANINVTQGNDVLQELTTNIDDPQKNNIIRNEIPF